MRTDLIFAVGTPFEVFNTIVISFAVNVVDLRFTFWIWYKRFGYQTVNTILPVVLFTLP